MVQHAVASACLCACRHRQRRHCHQTEKLSHISLFFTFLLFYLYSFFRLQNYCEYGNAAIPKNYEIGAFHPTHPAFHT
jgi:hypothetical protein